MLEGFRREVTANELCRREGIKPHSYYAWAKEFMEDGKDHKSKTNLKVKVLDFVQLGGPYLTERSTRFELVVAL